MEVADPAEASVVTDERFVFLAFFDTLRLETRIPASA